MSNVVFLLGQGYEGGGEIIIFSCQESRQESCESPRQLGLGWWWPHPGLSPWGQGRREHSQPQEWPGLFATSSQVGGGGGGLETSSASWRNQTHMTLGRRGTREAYLFRNVSPAAGERS